MANLCTAEDVAEMRRPSVGQSVVKRAGGQVAEWLIVFVTKRATDYSDWIPPLSSVSLSLSNSI